MIQSNFIDMEKMFALLDEVETVKDAPDAKQLVVSDGHVVFGKFLSVTLKSYQKNLFLSLFFFYR